MLVLRSQSTGRKRGRLKVGKKVIDLGDARNKGRGKGIKKKPLNYHLDDEFSGPFEDFEPSIIIILNIFSTWRDASRS